MAAGRDVGGGDERLAALVGRLRALLARDGVLPAERQLAADFQVKRHQLRRALGVLREGGEIERPVRARRGAVPGFSTEALVANTNPLEIIELRIAIEPSLARLAALRASPAEIALLQRQMAATRAGDHSREADIAFHRVIATAARNNLAVAVHDLLRAIGTDTRLQLSRVLQQRETEHHQAIVDAIAARDPDAAEHSMRYHLVAVQQRILDGLPASAASAA
ncbi:MAG: FCD domain-containing protein [Thalassobaculales bacterium]